MQTPDKITDRPDGTRAGQTAVTDQVPPEAAVIATDVPPVDPDGYRTAPDHGNAGWPAGVPFIVGNEACERFSFYGMRAILYVHLTSLFAAQAMAMGLGGADAADNQGFARANATAT